MANMAVRHYPDHLRRWVHPMENEAPNMSRQAVYEREQETRAFERALLAAERYLFSAPLQNRSIENLTQTLLLIHSLLITDPECKPGQYRSGPEDAVAPGKITIRGGDMEEHLKNHDRDNLPCYKELCKAMMKGRELEDIVNNHSISDRTKAFIHKYFDVVPSSKRVHACMQKFLAELQGRIKAGQDPIKTAAFAHREYVRIHPHLDGSGRMARFLMNAVLMQSGRQPIAFASEKTYTKAVKAENPVLFERMVRRLSQIFDREAEINPEDYTGVPLESLAPALNLD